MELVNKEFTGDDDTMTATGAMKGLSIYLMEDMMLPIATGNFGYYEPLCVLLLLPNKTSVQHLNMSFQIILCLQILSHAFILS
jgi:hypothetical protein